MTQTLTYTVIRPTPWQKWIQEQMRRHGLETQADVVRFSKGKIKKSVINRWLDSEVTGRPSSENCHLAAEGFNAPVLDAMIAAGHLTHEQAYPNQPPRTDDTVENADIPRLLREVAFKFSEMEAEIVSLRSGREPEYWSYGGRPRPDEHVRSS